MKQGLLEHLSNLNNEMIEIYLDAYQGYREMCKRWAGFMPSDRQFIYNALSSVNELETEYEMQIGKVSPHYRVIRKGIVKMLFHVSMPPQKGRLKNDI